MEDNLFEGIERVEPVDSQVDPVTLEGEWFFALFENLDIMSLVDSSVVLALVWTCSVSILFGLEFVLARLHSNKPSFKLYQGTLFSGLALANVICSMITIWLSNLVIMSVPSFAQGPLGFLLVLGVIYKIFIFDMYYVLRVADMTSLGGFTKPYLKALKYIRVI